jgi:DNA-binding GntR family transcriptional regulator
VLPLPSVPVDRASPVPLYYQVAQVLERAIESGDLPAGSRLENEIALAERLGLSRPTVRRAIAYLVDQGLVVRKRGIGTQILHAKVRRPLELTSLYDDLSADGRDPGTRVLTLETVHAPDTVAHALGIEDGAPVLSLGRLRLAGEEPLAILHNYIPVGLLALTVKDLEQSGLYQLMREVGIRPHMATQTVGARAASAAEARDLGERKGAPLLTMQRTTYDDAGRCVEYGDHSYRASAYAFEFVLVAR